MSTHPNIITRHENLINSVQHTASKELLSDCEAFITLLKCAFGTGCLAMPLAFFHTGWLLGILSTVGIGCFIVYVLHIMFDAMHRVCALHEVPFLPYSLAAELAVGAGPPFLQPFSRFCGFLVEGTLAFYHFGVCCVYVIFIASQLKIIGDLHYIKLDVRLYIYLLVIPLILTFIVRNIKYLVPFYTIANIFLLFGYIFLMGIMVINLPPLEERSAIKDFSQLPFFMGTVLFSMEAVGVIVTLEHVMKYPEHLLELYGILNQSMVVIIAMYTIFGFIGFWSYGDEVSSPVTDNMPMDWWPSEVATVMMALAIFFSYSLQGLVTLSVVWISYAKRFILKEDHLAAEYIFRIATVISSVLCAVIYPNFSIFLSFTGAFCLSQLGLIIPALMDACIRYSTGYGKYKIILWRDIVIIIVGFTGVIMGTHMAISGLLGTSQNVN